MQSSTAKGTQEVIRGLLQDSRKKTISFSGRDMIPYTGRKSEKWAQEDQRRASAMELNHCRPDRTSQREIPVQKWQMEYECISTDRKLAIGQYCLIFTSPASGLQRFFVGFSCLCFFFPKWPLDFDRYPLMTNLTLLSCPHKPSSFPSVRSNTERSHHRHQYPVSSPWPCTSGDTGKQYKTEGETSAIWGNFWGLTWFARWSYSPGVSPWHFLTAHCLLGERCAELAQLQELV